MQTNKYENASTCFARNYARGKKTIWKNESHSPSAVCRPTSSEYSPSPVLLKAFTRALYIELKCSPSTVQIVSFPQYTSCVGLGVGGWRIFHSNGEEKPLSEGAFPGGNNEKEWRKIQQNVSKGMMLCCCCWFWVAWKGEKDIKM